MVIDVVMVMVMGMALRPCMCALTGLVTELVVVMVMRVVSVTVLPAIIYHIGLQTKRGEWRLRGKR